MYHRAQKSPRVSSHRTSLLVGRKNGANSNLSSRPGLIGKSNLQKLKKIKTKFSRVLGFSKTLTCCAVISKNIAPIHFIKCIFPPKKFIMYFCEMYYKVMLCANLLIGAELLVITSTNWQH